MIESLNRRAKWWPDYLSADWAKRLPEIFASIIPSSSSHMSSLDNDLDDTRSVQRRRWEDQYALPPPSQPNHKVQVPLSVIVTLAIYLVGQLVGGIWWAATLQSDVRYQQQDNMKLWQKVETHDLQLGKMEAVIRTSVKEALADAGIQSRRDRNQDLE